MQIDDGMFGCTANGCDPCSFAGGQATCGGDQCVFAGCAPGFADCNGNLADFCEVNLNTDPVNCSGCGNACLVAHAAIASCSGGLCGVGTCDASYDDCDGDPLNGCESDLRIDPEHCNGCSTECPSTSGAQPFCKAGVCSEKACPIGFNDCDDDSFNGCETLLSLDANNCGICGRVCDLSNATSSCFNGKCQIDACSAGFFDCDTNAFNGCEAQVDANALHCGECGRGCETAGSSSQRCVAAQCFQLCDTGGGDCTHPGLPDPDDGCETDTGGDPLNCGTCSNVCSVPVGTPGCTLGKCSIADCPTDTGDCDGDVSNGCETDLMTDEAHCGQCGRACSSSGVASLVCSQGLCGSGCLDGFGNCQKPVAPAPDDGCESDVTADPLNCGGCNRVCHADHVLSLSCSAGKCDSTCELGWGNCLQLSSPGTDDGCEADVSATVTRCGSCTNDCSQQGGGGSGLKCKGPVANQCGCGGNNGRCNTSGATGTCDAATGRCSCGGTLCKVGEECTNVGSNDACSCNAGAACGSGKTCCEDPAGCVDLQTSAASCGACGHGCPPGFACSAAACGCSGDASCDAGGSGTCTSGTCHCGASTCAAGERCLANGSCG